MGHQAKILLDYIHSQQLNQVAGQPQIPPINNPSFSTGAARAAAAGNYASGASIAKGLTSAAMVGK